MARSSGPADPLSALVVGAGSIGRRHLANLAALGASPIGAVDPVEERARSGLEATGGGHAFRSLEQALDARLGRRDSRRAVKEASTSPGGTRTRIIASNTWRAVVSIWMDFLQRVGEHRVQISGERGVVGDGDPVLHAGVERSAVRAEALPPGGLMHMYLAELEVFLDAVRRGAPSPVTLDEGARDLELVLAFKQSALERRTIATAGREVIARG